MKAAGSNGKAERFVHGSDPRAGDAPALDVERLLGDAREVKLRLGGEEYRLRVTRNNKLILTK